MDPSPPSVTGGTIRCRRGWRRIQLLLATATGFAILSMLLSSWTTTGRRTTSNYFVTALVTRYTNHGHRRPLLSLAAAKSSLATASSSSSASTTPYRLVIVESPSKCKTIHKILNDYVQQHQLPYSYQVTSCYGHVRDLSKEKIALPADKDSPFLHAIPGIDLSHHQYKPLYQIMESKQHVVKELQRLARPAQQIILATDMDREGEAIAWHLQQLLLQQDDDSNLQRPVVPMERVSFTEITPSAVLDAIVSTASSNAQSQPPSVRSINPHLVAAQETRRILDRLVGFTLSPVLWRKIAPGLSAGRVQSVGMALVVHRERERLRFEATEYWDLMAQLRVVQPAADDNQHVTHEIAAKLVSVNNQPVAADGKDFTAQGRQLVSPMKRHLHEPEAHLLAEHLARGTWTIREVQAKQVKQSPPKPYRTSTLQQDANRRLSLSVDQSMRVAQQLYEAGFISYMRTDSSALSNQAEQAIELSVHDAFGSKEYDPSIRGKGSKHAKASQDKNITFAQEAHEAIRPAVQSDGSFATPEQLTGQVSDVAIALYRMIYQRTVACRMQPLVSLRTRVTIDATDGNVTAEFRATGSVVVQPGYSAAYATVSEDDDDDEGRQRLPPLSQGQVMTPKEVIAIGHETQPPPRFNEASFVKELEALGVGRPSTYASTIKTLRERAYVGTPLKDNSRRTTYGKEPSAMAKVAQRAAGGEDFTGAAQGPMVPSLSAFVVCDLLEKHCSIVTDPEFTAKMEAQLDMIASGEKPSEYSVRYLDDFYAGEDGLVARVKRIEGEVNGDDARRVSLPALEEVDKSSTDHSISVCVGPWGPFVKLVSNDDIENATTVSLPPGMAADLTLISPKALQSLVSAKQAGGLVLGEHPHDGRNIRLKTGRYGAFLQWGEDDEEGTTTHSLPKSISSMRSFDSSVEDEDGESDHGFAQQLGITFEDAVGYVGLPRTVSVLNDKPIIAAIGPYGPYLKYNNTYTSLKASDGDVLTIDPETAERLVRDRIVNGKPKGAIADLGEKDGAHVFVKKGRFGDYLNWKRINAKLPTEYHDNPPSMPLNDAWTLIQDAAGSSKLKLKKGKKRTDPSVGLPPAPKRPISAYLHFCAAKRADVAGPNVSLGDVSKSLATLWAAASGEDRKPFDELAAAGKRDYEQLMDAWRLECQANLNSTTTSKVKTTTRKKVGSAKTESAEPAKRPKSAYLHFCAEKRPEVAQQIKGLGAVTKELARLWAETKDRSKYEALARAEKGMQTEKQLQT